jgi:hypothetical protein
MAEVESNLHDPSWAALIEVTKISTHNPTNGYFKVYTDKFSRLVQP